MPSKRDSDIFVDTLAAMIKDPQALIIKKERWKDYYLFSIESPSIASEAQPGQFVMVRINPHPFPLLRRPFSIHSKNKKKLEIFFQITGIGTRMLSQKERDDFLDMIGPLGKGFQIEADLRRKDTALVGGGRGIAPLYFLAEELSQQGASVKIFYGGKSLKDLPLKTRFKASGFDLYCSTDDGSFGFKGLVSDYLKIELEKSTPDLIFSCGPEPMMKKIAHLAQIKNIPTQFSLESYMGCGFGICWGCVKRIRKNNNEEWVKICEEGPVFNGEEIIWQEDGK